MRGGSLHVTTGDSVLYLFHKAGLVGTQMAWRDALHEGPVPRGTLEDVSVVRADYLASRGYGHPIKLHRDFELRDKTLRRAAEFDEIVLWFEHDLYDQLQLLQILTTLGAMRLEPGRVSLVQNDHYLGMLDANELLSLLPKRRTVTDGIFASARTAWEVFTGDEARALARVASEERMGLPFVRAAFGRLCEEYPGTDGLSRSQRQALNAAASGNARNDELFRRSQAQEEASFMSDAAFAAVLDDLAAQPAPLIESRDGIFAATSLGRRLLAGDGDWLEQHPPDRYIGGVHLQDRNVPRYDSGIRAFASA